MVNLKSCAFRACLGILGSIAAIGLGGCQTNKSGACCAADASYSVAQADSDRGLLAKLVGDWRFEGSWTGAGGVKNNVQGRAAGVLVNNYFITMDVQTTSGELAGRTSRDEGSILFASEPGIGLTASAWGDASPSITRLVGHSESNGSILAYVPAGGNSNAVAFTIRFDGENSFIANITGGSNGQRAATYTFTRVTDK